MNRPLLTIAIPTWNRANILDEALSILFPQITGKFQQEIEIVVSDNASDDHTDIVIKNKIKTFPQLNIVHYTQKQNTGYFGNFQKSRALSNGCYFWLLSDNDHIALNLVSEIVGILKSKNPSFVFLRDWKDSKKKATFSKLKQENYTVEEAITAFNYRTTLISSVIFLNNKTEDDLLFEHFEGNTFIGFMYFLQSLDFKKLVVEVLGTSLFIRDTKVSFNAFKSFSQDLVACIEFAKNKEILPKSLGNGFMDKVISELVVRQYILFRITGRLHGMNPGSVSEVNTMLIKGLKQYKAFQQELNPLIKAKGFIFYRRVLFKHFFKILKQRLGR